jgi:hypothetical protein
MSFIGSSLARLWPIVWRKPLNDFEALKKGKGTYLCRNGHTVHYCTAGSFAGEP